MSNMYDDAKYGVIRRTWFGLTPKVGGAQAAGITLGTTSTMTPITTPTRWYPDRGPVKFVKVGYRTLATISNASSSARPLRMLTRGASGSQACLLRPNSCTQAAFSVASTTTFTVAQCKSGEYVKFQWGTSQTIKGGVAAGTMKKNTTLGTVAIFVDWVPMFGPQWDTF
jgi:hypothetical protein